MSFIQFLIESPRMISPLSDIPLETHSGNLEEYHMLNKFVIRKSAVFEGKLNSDVSLYFHSGDFKTSVFALDHTNRKVVYLMEYETDYHKQFGKYVYQSFVWVDKDCSVARRLPKDCFWQYPVAKEHVVLTDSLQTPDGKNFWLKRLKEAFTKNLFVYYVNTLNDEVIKLDNYEQVAEFDRKYQIWHETGLTKLMVISTKSLT